MVFTPPPLQYLPPDSQDTRHTDYQITTPMEIAIQLDRILFAGRPTTPTNYVREPKEAQGSGTKYHTALTELVYNDNRRPIMGNTNEVPKRNEEKLINYVSIILAIYWQLNCCNCREEIHRTFS